jgi:predicted nucleotidyltransferase
MGKPKDRDFIETVDGLLFCVVGYLHPPDRYTSYLKYLPDADGRWRRGCSRYARAIGHYHVSEVEKTYNLLKIKYPEYLYYCPVRNITISSVPHIRVRSYFRPRSRLHSIFNNGPSDKLEQSLLDLFNYITDVSSLREGDLGVTGSILTRSHNQEFSDIDLTVYGSTASRRLKEMLLVSKEEGTVIKPYSRERMADWSRKRSQWFPLECTELMTIANKRWNYGIFQGNYFSVHPVRNDGEITEMYGDRIYVRRGVIKGTAKIADSSESIYLPAIYEVDEVETETDTQMNVKQVVSYEGIFCDIFDEGSIIEFKGILEEVSGKEDFYRIVVGGANSRGGYIKPAP